MLLNQLINEYLDGDLSAENDVELRSLLRRDPAAKQEFDAAALVHISLACEDGTETPTNLKLLVLDCVDALAQNATHTRNTVWNSDSQPLISEIVKGHSLRTTVLTLLFLASAWIPIADNVIRYASNDTAARGTLLFDTVPPMYERRGTSAVASTSRVGAVSEIVDDGTTNVDKQNDTYADNIVSNQVEGHGSNAPVPAEPTNENTTGSTTRTLASLFGGHTVRSESPTSTEAHVEVKPEPPSTTSVIIATAYSAGLGSSVSSATNVRQVAASLGYVVDENSVMGLEVGATSYSVHRMITGTDPIGGMRGVMGIEPAPNASNGSKLASPTNPGLSYSIDSLPASLQESLVWGSAFVERRIMSAYNVDLRGRLGAGVSEDGLLGYGRVLGAVSIGDIVTFTVGAEVRGMNFRTGSIDGRASATTFGTVLTALTGVSVEF